MTRRILAQPLDAVSWEPFGWLPRRDSDALDGSQTLHFEWQDEHANVICHRADEVPHTSEGLVCEMFFHHLTHTQTLLVLNCRAVIAVAPASCSFSSASDLDAVRAFALGPHDSLVLHRGTWHWGPSPSTPSRWTCSTSRGAATPRTTVAPRWPTLVRRSRLYLRHL